ncbi:MAG: MlaD family protein [Armatimonadota bacterium]|nr:MlaD family protein [Armatimonadota bacterium]
MLRFRPEARVGLVIFIGVLTLIGMYFFLGGRWLQARTYRVYAVFRDVQRLDRGAMVRMAGVQVGRVDNITLTRDSRARVAMSIREDVKIPVGSAFRVTSGGLVGDIYVEVAPVEDGKVVLQPGQVVEGEDTVTLNQLAPQVSKLITEFQTSARSLNKILGDEQTMASIKNTVANTELASRKAADFMGQLQIIAAQNSAQVEVALANAALASEDFAAVAENLRGAFEKGGRADIEATLESGRKAVANLEAASASLNKLVGDQQLSSDLKATLANLRETSENAKAITERLGKIVGVKGDGRRERLRLVPSGSRLDIFNNFEDNRLRVDYNITIPTVEDRFYQLGLFDIGESTKVNLQKGRLLDPDTAFRYGFYASRFGVGLDRNLNSRTSLHADLYRPNDLHLELKGLYTLSDDLGLWAGTDDLLDSDNRSFLLGLQYRK